MTKKPKDLRSHRWLGVSDLRSFGHRSRLLQMGYARDDFMGKPVIGIFNTWSDINPCHAHFKQRVEDVKRGIWQAGGFPLELPVMTLSEPFQKPTTMLYRNFLAMEVEENIRSYPIDGAVLMGGCDKTGPALLMGAISADVPAIFVPAGSMLRGNWKGKVLGSGSDTWKYWDEKRAGNISEAEWCEIEQGIARSHGTCMTMGTAATMMSVIEAMGLSLPGSSSIPASDSGHPRMASETGRRIVRMVWEDLTPGRIITPDAIDNGISVHQAMGGSTNGIIHILALAHRAGLPLTLERFDEISQRVPVLANVRPSGRFLMEDFYYAGGLRALMSELGEPLRHDCLTVTGRTLGEELQGAETFDAEVIRPLSNPVYPRGGTAILRGNLAPGGAVIKPSAADPRLLRHSGPALVFDSYADMKKVIDRDDLAVTPDHVLVLRNAGPHGGPGMPEWGMLPIPGKLLRQGVRDMLRLSDARMSGTSYGACVLHVAPEAYVGGTLALVRNGDVIAIDVEARTLELEVPQDEIARRRAEWTPPPERLSRGYGAMFARHVSQADQGCDFDFLAHGEPLAEPEIN